VATVAAEAEQAGWDGLFVRDHVVHDKDKRRGQQFGDGQGERFGVNSLAHGWVT
jgi:hypothetical protein